MCGTAQPEHSIEVARSLAAVVMEPWCVEKPPLSAETLSNYDEQSPLVNPCLIYCMSKKKMLF